MYLYKHVHAGINPKVACIIRIDNPVATLMGILVIKTPNNIKIYTNFIIIIRLYHLIVIIYRLFGAIQNLLNYSNTAFIITVIKYCKLCCLHVTEL